MIARFIGDVGRVLDPHGRFLLLVSSLTGIREVLTLIEDAGYYPDIVLREIVEGEELLGYGPGERKTFRVHQADSPDTPAPEGGGLISYPLLSKQSPKDDFLADPGFPLIFAISLVAGFFGAMTGLGGGTIIVPVLTYLGVDIKLAIAASMVSVIATSCSSAAAYLREGLVNLKVAMYLEMFTVSGAIVGASITLASGQDILFVIFGCVLIGAAVLLFIRQRATEREAVDNRDRLSSWLELSGKCQDRAEKKTIVYYPSRAAAGRTRKGPRKGAVAKKKTV